ncbi:hypothetical protein J6590_080481 [Homalodisca vitripennis]|nr:hypothetical protein J6590_080481 [Homalodisca vitripennis]
MKWEVPSLHFLITERMPLLEGPDDLYIIRLLMGKVMARYYVYSDATALKYLTVFCSSNVPLACVTILLNTVDAVQGHGQVQDSTCAISNLEPKTVLDSSANSTSTLVLKSDVNYLD